MVLEQPGSVALSHVYMLPVAKQSIQLWTITEQMLVLIRL